MVPPSKAQVSFIPRFTQAHFLSSSRKPCGLHKDVDKPDRTCCNSRKTSVLYIQLTIMINYVQLYKHKHCDCLRGVVKFEIKYLDPNLESRKCPTCCSTVKTHLCTDRRIQSKTTSVSNQNYDVFSRASYKESINGGISRLCHQRSCRHEVSDKYWRKQFIWTMRSACELIL